MAQIFLSHSSADNPLAVRVRECLGDLGYDSVFLDVSPTDGLVPGAAWRDQLFTNLDRSDALVFIGTPTANASLWCHSELALARWLRKPILSLLFDGVDPHELVADLQGVNLAAADLSPDLLRPGLVALGLEQATRWDATRSPYPGLRAFDESYAPVFFGRERQIAELRQLVDPPSRARQGVVIPVLGPSGSGKSSLVRAGLVAALRPAPDWVVSDPWTPSDAPLAELGLALSHAAKRAEVAIDADECAAMLGRTGGMSDYLRRLREAGSVPADARVLVVIDQAEELVTLTGESERRAFFEALALSCTPPSPLRVVMTARTDMWDAVSALTNRFGLTVAPAVLHVPPLSRADLARVIAEPAKRSHLTLEDGLLQRLVEDTATGDALPLLAFTLARMTADATDGQLTHARYDAVGGVRGAIASRAAEVAHGARTESEVAAAILHLVGADENRPVTRLARVDSVSPAQREILDNLVDARLVVVRESAGQPVYAPAHEALFSAWPPLAEMIVRRRDDLRLRSRLDRHAADWRESGSGHSGLLSGTELDQAVDWQQRSSDLHTADITAYLVASQRRERRTRLLKAAIGAVVVALALALVVVVLVNAHQDRLQARDARVGELRAIAERELVHDPAAAAIALLEALDLEPDDTATTRLARRLLTSPARDVVNEGDEVQLLAVSAGTRLAATIQANDDTPVWDELTGRLFMTLPKSSAVAIRGDDRVAATIQVGFLSLYDLQGKDPPGLGSYGPATAVSFSPDGSLLVKSFGPVATLYDASDPTHLERVASWRAAGASLTGVSVTDAGNVLAIDGNARIQEWQPSLGVSTFHIGDVDSSAVGYATLYVDDAGKLVLVSSPSTTHGARVYDMLGSPQGEFSARSGSSSAGDLSVSTWAASLDPTGTRVAAFDLAGRGYAFDTTTRDRVASLVGGHSGLVNQLTFTRGGLLLSAGVDGTLRVWDVDAGSRSPGDDVPAALCDTFGDRIDEQSWALAMGSTPIASPCPAPDATLPETSLALTSPRPPAPVTVRAPARSVLAATFDDGPDSFPVGAVKVGDGILARGVSAGRYEMTVAGMANDRSQTWTTTPVKASANAYAVSVRVRAVGDLTGGCGLTVGDSALRVNATLDPRTGRGDVQWFVDGQGVGKLDFDAGPSQGATLALVRDGDHVEVRVGDRTVLAYTDDAVGAPRDVGMVVVGKSTACNFDDLAVTTD